MAYSLEKVGNIKLMLKIGGRKANSSCLQQIKVCIFFFCQISIFQENNIFVLFLHIYDHMVQCLLIFYLAGINHNMPSHQVKYLYCLIGHWELYLKTACSWCDHISKCPCIYQRTIYFKMSTPTLKSQNTELK